MAAFDHGFKIVTDSAGSQVARVADVPCTSWEPLTGDVQATAERLADRAFLAGYRGERFLVYVEAYTYWDEAAPWGVLTKSALLSERERLPTKTLLFILHPRGYRPQKGRFRLSVGGRLTQQVCFEEVCLWKKRPQPWWEQAPGLMALYPLCRHGKRPEEAVSHAAGAIERGERDSVRRADLLTVLGIFGRLAYQHFDPLEVIGMEKMKDSHLYDWIMDVGRIQIRRADILAILDERFGAEEAARFQEAVNSLKDLETMDRLHRLSVRCARPDEFRLALAAAQAPPPEPPKPRRASRGKK